MEDRHQREDMAVHVTGTYPINPDYHPYIQPAFSDGPPMCAKCGRHACDPVHNPVLGKPDHTKGHSHAA